MIRGRLKISCRALVPSSWATSPLTQVRMRRESGPASAAGMSSGPSGVKPSRLFERTFDPLSAAFMS